MFERVGASQERCLSALSTTWFTRSREGAEDGKPFTIRRRPSRSVGAPKLVSRPTCRRSGSVIELSHDAAPPRYLWLRVSQPNSRYAIGRGGAQPSRGRRIILTPMSSKVQRTHTKSRRPSKGKWPCNRLLATCRDGTKGMVSGWPARGTTRAGLRRHSLASGTT